MRVIQQPLFLIELSLVSENLQEERPTYPDLDVNVQHYIRKFEEQEQQRDIKEVDTLNIEVNNVGVMKLKKILMTYTLKLIMLVLTSNKKNVMTHTLRLIS